MSTPRESMTLDDCDAAIDYHTSNILGNLLVLETLVDVQLHFHCVHNVLVSLMDYGKLDVLYV